MENGRPKTAIFCAFAWYQATSKAAVAVQNDSFTVTTKAYSESIGGVKFIAAISEATIQLELSAYDSTNQKGITGYIAGGVAKTVDATPGCYKMLEVTITAELNGTSDLTLPQLLKQVYDDTTGHTVTIRATPAGQALVKWIAAADTDDDDEQDEPTAEELKALYGGSLATNSDTTIALASDGSVGSWTLYLAIADRTSQAVDSTVEDTAASHEDDAVTVTPVAPY